MLMIKADIQDQELVSHLNNLPKDDMVVFVMAQGRIRGAVFNGTHFVNQMRAQHNTGILETYILGQASLSGALLIPACMKGREHINWHYEAEQSPAKGFCVDVDSTGWVRSYLLNDHIPIEKPLESWDMTPFLGGEGFMTIQKMHPGDKYPSNSSVNTTGNIADDLVFYFDRSEQIKTALTTSIQMDKQGRVIGAGGLYIQVMPETGGHFDGKQKLGSQLNSSADIKNDEELIEKIENAFKAAPSLGTWFSEGNSIEDLVYGLFREFEPAIALHRDIKYECPCNKETYINHIKSLPKAEIEDMKKSGNNPLEIVCRNCGSVYHIDLNEI